MKFPSLHILKISFAIFAFALCVSSQASAACPEPASGHLSICQPSANSTIYQVPHIEAVANPSSGSITTMKVYIDNKLVFQNGGPEISLFEGGVMNGTHQLVVNAWDSLGRLYKAQEAFTVTGNLSPCPPATVGVRICSPASGQVVAQSLGLSLGFKGNAPIRHVRAYVGSTPVFDYTPGPGESWIMGAGAGTTAGNHTLNVVAWDANNVTYT